VLNFTPAAISSPASARSIGAYSQLDISTTPTFSPGTPSSCSRSRRLRRSETAHAAHRAPRSSIPVDSEIPMASRCRHKQPFRVSERFQNSKVADAYRCCVCCVCMLLFYVCFALLRVCLCCCCVRICICLVTLITYAYAHTHTRPCAHGIATSTTR
jgi:hypothetical protein